MDIGVGQPEETRTYVFGGVFDWARHAWWALFVTAIGVGGCFVIIGSTVQGHYGIGIVLLAMPFALAVTAVGLWVISKQVWRVEVTPTNLIAKAVLSRRVVVPWEDISRIDAVGSTSVGKPEHLGLILPQRQRIVTIPGTLRDFDLLFALIRQRSNSPVLEKEDRHSHIPTF